MKGKKQKQRNTYAANRRTRLSRGITDFEERVSAFKQNDTITGTQI
jgi:hypothetical protein